MSLWSARKILPVVGSLCWRCGGELRHLTTTAPVYKVVAKKSYPSPGGKRQHRYPPMNSPEENRPKDYDLHSARSQRKQEAKNEPKDLPLSMRQKFRLFTNESEEIIDSAKAEWVEIEAPEEPDVDQFEGLNLQRGVTGVLDIEDLITVLRLENAVDICVIRIPPEQGYSDYMVICGGTSGRHLTAIAQFIRKYYKKKKLPEDPHLTNSLGISNWNDSWISLDLGNIVVHFMDNWTRDKYDLESLWAIGPAEDYLMHAPKEDILRTVEQFTKIIQPPPLKEAAQESSR